MLNDNNNSNTTTDGTQEGYSSDDDDDDLDLDLEPVFEDSFKEDDSSITVRQLRSGSLFRVPILVQGVQTSAVIDTAAEVTIISDKLYETFQNKPKMMKEVVMNTAGRN